MQNGGLKGRFLEQIFDCAHGCTLETFFSQACRGEMPFHRNLSPSS